MDSGSYESEAHFGGASTQRLARPTTCQHDQYERQIEGHGFARSQCLGCSRSWVEVDITVEVDTPWMYDGLQTREERRRRVRAFGNLFEDDARGLAQHETERG